MITYPRADLLEFETMPTIELNPVIRSQEFITVEQDNRNEFRLRGSFVLPAEKRALIGIRKEFAAQCPDGFTESPGGYFYFYLNGDGEENEVDQVVEIPGQTAHGLRMFVKLWEGDGPLKLELENIKSLIDLAIDSRDQKLFHQLSKQYYMIKNKRHLT